MKIKALILVICMFFCKGRKKFYVFDTYHNSQSFFLLFSSTICQFGDRFSVDSQLKSSILFQLLISLDRPDFEKSSSS